MSVRVSNIFGSRLHSVSTEMRESPAPGREELTEDKF